MTLSPISKQRKKEAMREISAGQKVICKHKNGRYYQCDVVQLTKETFYEVNFDDGTFSDNLFPEDIVVRGIACDNLTHFIFPHLHYMFTHLCNLIPSVVMGLAKGPRTEKKTVIYVING